MFHKARELMKNRSLTAYCSKCRTSETCIIAMAVEVPLIDGPPDTTAQRETTKTYRQGEYIPGQEHAGQYMPVVCQGLAAVTLLTEEGEEILIHAHGPGSIIDLPRWIGKQRAGSHSARAVTDVTLRFVAVGEFTALLKQSDTARTVFLEYIGAQLQIDQRTLILLRSKNTYGRIQLAIHELIQLLKLKREGPVVLPYKIPRWFLSSYTGLRPETVSRMLSRLRNEGLIVHQNHRLVIPNYSNLARSVERCLNGLS